MVDNSTQLLSVFPNTEPWLPSASQYQKPAPTYHRGEIAFFYLFENSGTFRLILELHGTYMVSHTRRLSPD